MNTNQYQPEQVQNTTYGLATLKILGIVGAGLLSACQTTPNFDSKFGEAARATFSQQIINPNAGNNSDPVTGLDGQAARDVIENYQKSFAQPEKNANASNIGVGESSGK